MGAYSTDDLLPAPLLNEISESIIQPAIRGMAREGNTYRGFLYFGLMLTPQGPQVLEFNCRMGDPETQAIVPRMDFDLAVSSCRLCRGTTRSRGAAMEDRAPAYAW